jgi:hypothetical protein
VCFAGTPLHELRFVEAAIVTALLMMSIGLVANAQAAPAPAPAGQSSATPASATDIVGLWQGTLHIPQANRDLRIENKIWNASSSIPSHARLKTSNSKPII